MSSTQQLVRPDDRSAVTQPTNPTTAQSRPVSRRLVAAVEVLLAGALVTAGWLRRRRAAVPLATMPQRFGDSYRWADGTWTHSG